MINKIEGAISTTAFMSELRNLLFKYSAKIIGNNGIDIEVDNVLFVWRDNEINENNISHNHYKSITIGERSKPKVEGES